MVFPVVLSRVNGKVLGFIDFVKSRIMAYFWGIECGRGGFVSRADYYKD